MDHLGRFQPESPEWLSRPPLLCTGIRLDEETPSDMSSPSPFQSGGPEQVAVSFSGSGVAFQLGAVCHGGLPVRSDSVATATTTTTTALPGGRQGARPGGGDEGVAPGGGRP